jgi:ASC-1-like (ASCH) protein
VNHQLKIEPQYLQNLLNGRKKAEIRINDRDYQLGDTLEFWNREADSFVKFTVTHIHSGLGLQPNYVILSVEESLK